MKKRDKKGGFTPKGSKSSWKNFQSQKKSQQQVAFGVAALLVVLFLILVSKLFDFVGSLNKPYRPDSPDDFLRQYRWNGSSTINLVVKSDQVYVLSFDSTKKSLTALKIPEETYFNLPFSFGRWPVRSIYGLGQAEKPPRGAKLLKDSVSTNLGLPIDGYLITSESSGAFSATLERMRSNPWQGITMLRQSRSDLTPIELLQLAWGIGGVRQDKLRIVDFGLSTLSEWVLLADGSRVLGINQGKTDQFSKEEFIDNQIEEEGLSIGIYNATSHTALADRVARVVSNMGGRVIFINNVPVSLEKTAVLGKPSYSLDRLTEIFAPRCISSADCRKLVCLTGASCSIEELEDELSRSEVNILIGEDYFLRYNKL